MKCCIAYASTHHGNTKKVVDAIAKEFEVDIMIYQRENSFRHSRWGMNR